MRTTYALSAVIVLEELFYYVLRIVAHGSEKLQRSGCNFQIKVFAERFSTSQANA